MDKTFALRGDGTNCQDWSWKESQHQKRRQVGDALVRSIFQRYSKIPKQGEIKMTQDTTDKLRLFALAANGKSYSIEVPVGSDMDIIEESNTALLQQGLTDDELDNVILSATEFDDVPAAAAQAALLAVPAVETEEQSKLPTVPKPTTMYDALPEKSEEKLVSTNDVVVCVYVRNNLLGKKRGKYFPVDSLPKGFCLDPEFPDPSKILYKRYWINLGSEIMNGPQTFERSITTTHGMSKTKTKTLSAKLGVSVKGLSAELTATTSEQITVTEETSVTRTNTVPVEAGKIVVYTLWQLVEKFVLADNDGKPINWSGYLTQKKYLKKKKPFHILPAEFKDNVFTNNTTRYWSDKVEIKPTDVE